MGEMTKAKVRIMKIWVIMVRHPISETWFRAGPIYRKKETAASWVSFVKSSWRGMTVRVRGITLRINKRGDISVKMRKKMSDVYGIDVDPLI